MARRTAIPTTPKTPRNLLRMWKIWPLEKYLPRNPKNSNKHHHQTRILQNLKISIIQISCKPNSDKFEFKSNNNPSIPIVKGRLKKNISFRKNIGTNETIQNVILEGYKIPFVTTPNSAYFNNKSAFENRLFVDEAVNELLNKE